MKMPLDGLLLFHDLTGSLRPKLKVINYGIKGILVAEITHGLAMDIHIGHPAGILSDDRSKVIQKTSILQK